MTWESVWVGEKIPDREGDKGNGKLCGYISHEKYMLCYEILGNLRNSEYGIRGCCKLQTASFYPTEDKSDGNSRIDNTHVERERERERENG